MNHKSQWLTSLLVMLLFSSLRLHAQDTLRITLPEAEKQFLQKNLDLLAEKYNIDIARAQVIQARFTAIPTFHSTAIFTIRRIKKSQMLAIKPASTLLVCNN